MTRKLFFILFEELILHLSTRPNLPSIQRTFAPGRVPSANIPISNHGRRPDGHGFFLFIKGVCGNQPNLLDALPS